MSSTSASHEPFAPEGAHFDCEAYVWHTMPMDQVMEVLLLPDLKVGVQPEHVEVRGREMGNNYIPIDSGPNVLKMLLGHFCNSITFILAFVAVVSAYFKDWGEFGVVVFVILFNGFIGFYQEYSAEKSLQGLKAMTAGTAKVLRGGKVIVIPVDEVVIGDVVILEQGSTVPADVRLYEVSNMQIDEALLTGEAEHVTKHTDAIEDGENKCPLGDRKNIAFRNTTVVVGRAKGLCVAAGVHTQMGKLAKRLTDDSGSNETPLQRKMKHLMWVLFGLCFIIAIVVFAVNKFNFTESTILYAAAVAIAILPESLIAVITVAMTISVRRMATQRCIVRKLGSLEVLGNVTDICSDKTGTLTENKMVAARIVLGIDMCIVIQGSPMNVHSSFNDADTDDYVNMAELRETNAAANEYFKAAALCGNTHLTRDGEELTGTGNPTEIAIQAMCWKVRAERPRWEANGWVHHGEFPFDSAVKRMSAAYVHEKTKETLIVTKGAPERVLALCKWQLDKKTGKEVELSQHDRDLIDFRLRALADLSLRCICLSKRSHTQTAIDLSKSGDKDKRQLITDLEREDVEKDLVFLGLVGIYDPPRPESKISVHICQRAGIKVRMLTGDHAATATAIAKQLAIVTEETVDDESVMTGPDFEALDEAEVDKRVDLPSVVGRCSPESKVKMIQALHRRGRVVAMTGDGFNDSPSIKAADVGCAMGSGTDVTKGVADIIITDDDFTTIVKAVAEGRRIAASVSKFVIHLLSGNVAEVIVLVLGLPIQLHGESVFVLSPIEILWLNMFTGSPPATGLSLDEADDDILHRPPKTGGFFTNELISDTIVYGVNLGLCSLCSFIVVLYGLTDGIEGKDCNSPSGENCSNIKTARATAFTVLYLGLLIHAYNVRAPRKSVFFMKWFDNNWLWGSVAFGVVTLVPILYVPVIAKHIFIHDPLTWHWGVVAVALTIFVLFAEIYKIVKNKVDPPVLYAVTSDEEAMEDAVFQNEIRATVAQSRKMTVEEIGMDDMRGSFARQASFMSTE